MAEGVELEFTEKTKRIGIMIAIMAMMLSALLGSHVIW